MKALSKLPIVYFIIFMLAVTAIAVAQHPHDPEKRGKKHTEWMKTELSLSDDQSAKVNEINQKYASRHKALREEMRKQMQAMDEEKSKELSQVLTKDQMDKYNAKKKEMREHRRGHHGKGSPGKGPKHGCCDKENKEGKENK